MSQDEEVNAPSGTVPSRTALEVTRPGTGALTVSTPSVVATAQAFGCRPEKLLARVEKALPAVFEQHVYLAVARFFIDRLILDLSELRPILPAKILKFSMVKKKTDNFAILAKLSVVFGWNVVLCRCHARAVDPVELGLGIRDRK